MDLSAWLDASRERNRRMEAMFAEAIADDSQDTAAIEQLIAESDAATDEIEGHLITGDLSPSEVPAEPSEVTAAGHGDEDQGPL